MTTKEYIVSHIVNLFKIKSIVTIALTLAFVVLSLKGEIKPEQFLTIFTMVISFYFGLNAKKESAEAVKAEDKPVAVSYIPSEDTIVYDAVYENDSQQSAE